MNSYEMEMEAGYSNSLDLLIEIGRTLLLHPKEDEYLEELKREWQDEIQGIETREELETGLNLLVDDVENSLNMLSRFNPFNEDPDSDWKVPDALGTLNQVVFLYKSMDRFAVRDKQAIEAYEIQGKFYQRVDKLFRDVTMDRLSPCLRLVPFNSWRVSILEMIPVESRYLFPWYQLWSDIPEIALEDLLTWYGEYLDDRDEAVSAIPEDTAVLLAEIQGDPEIFNVLKYEAMAIRQTAMKIGQSHLLRFLLASKEIAKNYMLSPKIKYLVGTASKIVPETVESQAEKIERLLLAGVCGPLLEDDQRLDVLGKVFADVRKLDKKEMSNSKILLGLADWLEKEVVEPTAILKSAFDSWMAGLNRVTPSSVEPLPERGMVFWEAVERLIKARPGSAWTKKVRNWLGNLGQAAKQSLDKLLTPLEDLYVPQPALELALDGARGEGEDFLETSFKSNVNPIMLTIMPNEENELPLLKRDKKVKEYDELWEKLRGSRSYWWGGIAVWRKRPEINLLPVEKTHKLPCHYLKDSDTYAFIVLGISDSKESLSNALNAVSAMETGATPPAAWPGEPCHDIVWIFYKVISAHEEG